MNVLIAEDDTVSRRLLEASLQRWGYDVSAAADGEAAWSLFEQGEFPFVISDWMMPQTDGVELIRRIRASDRPGYTYCILLTARSEKDDLVQGMEAGADDFLVKPFDRDELRVRLRAGERIIRLEQTLAEQNRALREAQAANVNEEFEQSFSGLERVALGITEHVGSVGFFLILVVWSLLWLAWNTLAPSGLRFDPAPAFVLWLFVSNLIQITLMPLLLVGQNLQSRHATLRAESDYQVNVAAAKRIDVMLRHLERLETRTGRQGELVREILDRLHRSAGRLPDSPNGPAAPDPKQVYAKEPERFGPAPPPPATAPSFASTAVQEPDEAADGAELARLVRDDGRRLVERIREAAARGDAAQISRAAHGLKDAAASLNAAELAGICAHLEESSRRGETAEAAAAADRIEEHLESVCAELERNSGGDS